MSLTKEEILAADDCKVEQVSVPEWGDDGHVFVRTMTGDERDDFEAETLGDKPSDRATSLKHIRARLAAYTLCDQQDNRLFGKDDIELLGQKSAAALDRVFAVASRLNRLRKEDVEELIKGE